MNKAYMMKLLETPDDLLTTEEFVTGSLEKNPLRVELETETLKFIGANDVYDTNAGRMLKNRALFSSSITNDYYMMVRIEGFKLER